MKCRGSDEVVELTPKLDINKKEPLYVQLYESIKHEITSGMLSQGTRLPSKRKLAQHLQISQSTIETAYEQLVAEGYIESLPRKGFFVCKMEQSQYDVDGSLPFVEEKPYRNIQYHYDFAYTGVDSASFPFALYRKLANEVVREDNDGFLMLGHPQGEWDLRKEIVKYMYESRGVRCSPSQIIIGSGTQQLLRIVFQLLQESTYAVEDPGYHRQLLTFEKRVDQVEMIPLDHEGMILSRLEESKANVALVTPSHQFPSGSILSISRRMQLLKWAWAKEDRYIVEDDYDSEFRYTGKPIPALQGLDSHQKVIYMSTFSKALMPSMRVSYMVLPLPLIEKYKREYFFYTQTVSRIDQEILIAFLKEGHWGKHIQKMRVTYRKKRDALVTAISTFFPKQVEIIGEDSGLHILLRPHNGMTETELIQTARAYGVNVYPVSVYGSSDHATVLLGFASLTEKQLVEAVQILVKSWF